MKRILVLCLFAMGLISSATLTTTTANAAVVTCSQANPLGTGYPYKDWTKYCTGTTQTEGQSMSGIVHGAFGAASSELGRANNGNLPMAGQPSNGVRYFLFANPQDYIDSSVSLGLGAPEAVDNEAFGVTHFDANKIPVYSAVFKQNMQGRTFSTAVAYGTGQQVGRSIDYLSGYIKDGGIVAVTNFRFSDTGASQWQQLYELELAKDHATLNAMNPCRTTLGGPAGLFSGYADSTYPTVNYICDGTNGNGLNLRAPYNGLADNVARIHQAWPKIFPAALGAPGSAPDNTYAALYAEAYSVNIGGNDKVTTGRTADRYFETAYKCTTWLAAYTTNRGYLPTGVTADQMPVGCVNPAAIQPAPINAPIMITKCKKVFNGDQHFPDGNVFSCYEPDSHVTDPLASGVITKLTALGRNNMPAGYTAIKTRLTIAQANVYLFQNPNSYIDAFSKAGMGAATTTIGTDNAKTYPYGRGSQNPQTWYAIVVKSTTEGGTDTDKQSYITSHELGHVISTLR